MNPAILKQVIHQIQRSERILILPSSPPDGDSLGSAIALYLMLKKLHKKVTAVCTEPIPNSYQFLPLAETIEREFSASQDFIVTLDCSNAEVDNIRYNVEQNKVNIIITPKKGQFSDRNLTFHHGRSKYDLIITVDTGDIEQLGSIYENHVEMFYNIPVINIDHHPSNAEFGKINLIDITASATTEMIFYLFKELDPQGKFMDEDIATALLAGIITDTGSFQNANTTPRSLELAAELVTLGARQQEIIRYVYKTKDLTMLKLWGKILSRIKFDSRTKLVWSSVSLADLKETGSTLDQSAGIIDNLMSNAPEAEIVLLLKEKQPGLISGSLRTSHAAVDASKIAALFDGGGHVQAAGFRHKVISFDEGVQEIISKITQYQIAQHLPELIEHAIIPQEEKIFQPTRPVEAKITPKVESAPTKSIDVENEITKAFEKKTSQVQEEMPPAWPAPIKNKPKKPTLPPQNHTNIAPLENVFKKNPPPAEIVQQPEQPDYTAEITQNQPVLQNDNHQPEIPGQTQESVYQPEFIPATEKQPPENST